MAEKIIEVDFGTEMGQSYVDYAMSVITERALPDIRDGLKPVQRRVLYALNQLSSSDTPHRKCARIVGDTMGKYHPHGDSSIYECLVNLAQGWKLNNPLVNPQGNFGSVNGDGAAAMRYTEARIDEYTEDVCMKDLKYFKDTFIPNFDNTENEPVFLPFQVPNILVGGTSGIAVGMDSEIPTHNLKEVIDALIMYLENPNVTLDEIMEVLPAPDFATGGIINSSKEALRDLYETGIGKLRVRGKYEIRDAGYGRKSICITEIPCTMIGQTKKFLDTVADLVRNRELPAVVDIADRGDKDGECLCIDVKKGTSDEEIENIVNILYKKAKLEDTKGVRMRVIHNGSPKIMGLMKILSVYTEFKQYLYQTKYEKLLAEQENVKEIKEGLVEAVDCIDLIIEIIRGSKNVTMAKECLMHGKTKDIKFRYKGSEEDAKQLKFTEKQADAILSMRLQKLIGLEIEALKKELQEAVKLSKKYSKLLSSKKEMTKQMVTDLELIREKHQKPRKTQIGDFGEVVVRKAEETVSDVVVLVDRFSYIKVIDKAIFDRNIETIKNDYRIYIKSNTAERIGIFTTDNTYHTIKISELIKTQAKKNVSKKQTSGTLLGKLSDKGIQLSTIFEMDHEANLLYIDTVEQIADSTLIFVSKQGCAKKVLGNVFDISRKNSKAYNDNDEVIFIGKVNEKDDIVVKSEEGYYSRIETDSIQTKGKSAGMNKIITLGAKDSLTDVAVGTTKSNLILQDGTEIPFTKIKLLKKGNKGVKMRL